MTDTQYDNIPPGPGWQPAYIKKSRGAGFWVAVGLASFFFLCTLLLFMLFIGSLVLSKALITSTATKGKKQAAETVIEGSGESKVAIIPVKAF